MPRDLRCAARQLTRSPGLTVLAILMVGLGIAATTTIFTLVNTVFLPMEVVGVVEDARQSSLEGEPEPYYYTPFPQVFQSDMTLVVRTTGDPSAILPELSRQVKAIDPDLPVEPTTMEEHLGFAVLPQRLAAWVLGVFGVTGLVALGLYGVLSYLGAQRTPEIGIRLALGARVADIYGLVLRRGVVLTGVGLGIGLLAGFALTRLLAGFLIGITPTDPVVLGSLSLLLAVVAILASYLPARRATRIDPMSALRVE